MSNWTKLTPAATPNPSQNRHYGAWGYDETRDQWVLFGGWTYPNTWNNETWVYDYATANWSQLSPATSPAARAAGAMMWDSVNGKLLLFGGANDNWNTCYNDLWSWNGTTWTEEIADGVGSSPGQRAVSVLAPSSDGTTALLCGGQDDNSDPLGDCWALTIGSGTYSWAEATASAGYGERWSSALSYYPPTAEWVLWGGVTRDGVDVQMFDTWVSNDDGATWSEIDDGTDADVESYGALVYDPDQSQLLLIGGSYDYGVPGTGERPHVCYLERSSASWLISPPSGTWPLFYSAFGLVRRPKDGRAYVTGGRYGGTPTDEYWSLDLSLTNWRQYRPGVAREGMADSEAGVRAVQSLGDDLNNFVQYVARPHLISELFSNEILSPQSTTETVVLPPFPLVVPRAYERLLWHIRHWRKAGSGTTEWTLYLSSQMYNGALAFDSNRLSNSQSGSITTSSDTPEIPIADSIKIEHSRGRDNLIWCLLTATDSDGSTQSALTQLDIFGAP